MRHKNGFNRDGVSLQRSIDSDLVARKLREFGFMTFQGVDPLVDGQRALHAALVSRRSSN